MTLVSSPIVWLASGPTYAMRGPRTATLVFGTISPEVTLTSVPPRTTNVAGRSPLAVAASSRVISCRGILLRASISTLPFRANPVPRRQSKVDASPKQQPGGSPSSYRFPTFRLTNARSPALECKVPPTYVSSRRRGPRAHLDLEGRGYSDSTKSTH